MSSLGDLRVALVHDELTRRGGAEIVFEELIRFFPRADIYALYTGRPRIRVDGKLHTVRTTFLQHFPRWFRRHPSRLLPFLAQAAEQLDLANYDLVLTSASAFAKAVVTRATVLHVCYCHTPTRYLWEPVVKSRRWPVVVRWPGQMLLHYLRLLDFAAAQRVDHFIANSRWTAERIETYYRKPSAVIYPPVDTSFYTPAPVQRRAADAPFLCVGRLTSSKYFEHAITVCEKLRMPLLIIGTGDHLSSLKKIAGPHTRFVGSVSREELRQHYRQARALLQPGVEDFGLATVEAQACGTPVIALGHGGALETIISGTTGILYKQPTVEGLAEAVRVFLAQESDFRPEPLQRHALRFSQNMFRHRLTEYLADVIAQKRQALV